MAAGHLVDSPDRGRHHHRRLISFIFHRVLTFRLHSANTTHHSCLPACIEDVFFHVCGARPVCLLIQAQPLPHYSGAAAVCSYVCSDDARRRRREYAAVCQSELRSTPSCTICQVSLHSGLANMSLCLCC